MPTLDQIQKFINEKKKEYGEMIARK